MRRVILWIDNVLAHLMSMLLRLLPIRTRRVRCLLVHGDEMLLVINRLSHKGQRWTLPGGGIKKNESVEEAAVREVAEELAIIMSIRHVQYVGRADYAHGRLTEQLEIVTATLDSRDFVRRKLELLDAQWFPLEKPPQSHQDVVDEAIKILNSKS